MVDSHCVTSRLVLFLSVCVLTLPVLAIAADPPGRDAGSTTSAAIYRPITGSERAEWFVKSTIGGKSLLGGLFSAGWGTLLNSPSEYGPHWEGFGKRYGMRFTGLSTGNAMEAGIGALWGEDPRYFRVPDEPFKNRAGHVIKMTFFARKADGGLMPAYSRYIAISGNNFLSNTWRADSEADATSAVTRTLTGFLGRMASNAFDEFWPTVKQHLKRNKRDKP